MAAEIGSRLEHGDGLIRRARLPADRRTPAAARAIVRDVLAEVQLEELLNEALLLTTELSTNAVVHAATDLELEVTVDRDGISVLVTDFAPGPLEHLPVAWDRAGRFGPVSERGRGLLLVNHFASRWGTTHLPGRKGVWFRLDRKGAVRSSHPDGGEPETLTDAWRPPGMGSTRLGTGDTDPFDAIAQLVACAPDPYAEDPLPTFAADLLARLAELTNAASGSIRIDRGDGAGPRPLARYGTDEPAGAERLRLPLTINRPYGGELELIAPRARHAESLAALAVERLSLHLENDRLRRLDMRRQSWLTFLAEASELLAQSLDVQLTLALIPHLVVPRLGAWCAVHTVDEWGQLTLASAAHSDESRLPQLSALMSENGPESIQLRLREAIRTRSMVLVGTPPMDGFALPLVARGQQLGTLSVGRNGYNRNGSDEFAVLQDLARRSALAIENARIHDERRRVAQALQQSLMPPVLPVVEGIGLAAEYVPTRSDVDVGGDFYDVLSLPDGRWLLVIGDVSGKGVQAATVTGLVRDVLRVLVGDGKSLPEVLARLNETLLQRGGGRYCTLALAAIDRGADDRLNVRLHLAGHEQPVLVRMDGRAAFVGEGGTALGLLESIETPAADVLLDPGDALIFYTDGVTERRRGRELFGVTRLREAAAPLAGYPAPVMAARIRTAAINFSTEPPRDDIAVLVVRNDFGG
ncbi:MAG TPA: SpoIIE family protein phosphatase [Micromonosporaceae bacterium]